MGPRQLRCLAGTIEDVPRSRSDNNRSNGERKGKGNKEDSHENSESYNINGVSRM